MVVLCICTRHIPPYTMLYRHMTVNARICRDIRVSGFQMLNCNGQYTNLKSVHTSLSTDRSQTEFKSTYCVCSTKFIILYWHHDIHSMYFYSVWSVQCIIWTLQVDMSRYRDIISPDSDIRISWYRSRLGYWDIFSWDPIISGHTRYRVTVFPDVGPYPISTSKSRYSYLL